MITKDQYGNSTEKFIETIYNELLNIDVNGTAFIVFADKSTELYLETPNEMKSFIDDFIMYYAELQQYERCIILENIKQTII